MNKWGFGKNYLASMYEKCINIKIKNWLVIAGKIKLKKPVNLFSVNYEDCSIETVTMATKFSCLLFL